MPSPIGHALAGLATAWGGGRLREPAWPLAAVCAALAAIPDADLLLPGAHRTFTHSFVAVAVVLIIAAAVTGKVTGKIDWRIVLLCGAAYGSHVLMDWLGADPNPPSGIQLLWPSAGWFIAPWTIFPGTERRHILSVASFLTNLKAVGVECAVMAPVAAGAWLTRTYRSRGRLSARDILPQPSGAAADTAGTSDRRARPGAR